MSDTVKTIMGQALSDEIAAGAPEPDWCDAREIDRCVEAQIIALGKASYVIVPREPTEAMIAAGLPYHHRDVRTPEAVMHHWHALIDAALGEEEEK